MKGRDTKPENSRTEEPFTQTCSYKVVVMIEENKFHTGSLVIRPYVLSYTVDRKLLIEYTTYAVDINLRFKVPSNPSEQISPSTVPNTQYSDPLYLPHYRT